MNTPCDLLIAGAGLAGSVLALAAAQQGLQVVLVDPRPAGEAAENRYLALAWDNCRTLARLGLWEALRSHAAPVRRVEVTQQGGLGTLWLESTALGLEALGYVLPAAVLLRTLAQRLEATSVRCLRQAQVVQVWGDVAWANAVVLHGEARETWQARLVVAADGADSQLRRQAHLASTRRDYDQMAIIGGVALARPLDGIAYERFLRAGALAVLPTSDALRATVIWSAPTAEAEALLALDESAWLQRLQTCLGGRVPLVDGGATRHAYPLALHWAPRQVQQRLLLLGNAAHTLHPLAAQGFNLILRDVAELSQCLAQASDSGNPHLLARYQAQRWRPQRLTVGITDVLARGMAWPWSAPLRGVVLGVGALLPQRTWLGAVVGAPPTQSLW